MAPKAPSENSPARERAVGVIHSLGGALRRRRRYRPLGRTIGQWAATLPAGAPDRRSCGFSVRPALLRFMLHTRLFMQGSQNPKNRLPCPTTSPALSEKLSR